MVHLTINDNFSWENISVFYFLSLVNSSLPSASYAPKLCCPLCFTGGSPGGFIALLHSHVTEISGRNGDKCVFSLLYTAELIILYIRFSVYRCSFDTSGCLMTAFYLFCIIIQISLFFTLVKVSANKQNLCFLTITSMKSLFIDNKNTTPKMDK